MKNNNSSTRAPINSYFDLTVESANAKLRIPVIMSKQLWLQITGETHLEPGEPRLFSMLSQLKRAIGEHCDGCGYFGALERGIDFDVEIGARSTTAFASLNFEMDRAVLRLKTADEVFAELPERLVPISSELDWQDPIRQAKKIARAIRRDDLIEPSNLVRLNERNDFSDENIVHSTSAGGAYVRFADRSPRATWRYAVPGTQHYFLIWGVAYNLRKATKDSITLAEDAVVALERQLVRRQNPPWDVDGVHSIKISHADLRALFPCGDHDEHYNFRTVAGSVDWLKFGGTRLCRIGVVLTVPADSPFRATVFAHADVLGGYVPRQGDTIQGEMLLSGYQAKSETTS